MVPGIMYMADYRTTLNMITDHANISTTVCCHVITGVCVVCVFNNSDNYGTVYMGKSKARAQAKIQMAIKSHFSTLF